LTEDTSFDAVNARIKALSRQLQGLPGEVLKRSRPDEYARITQALDEATRAYFLKLFDEDTASLP